jgi:bacillithiol biosynthesis cysteine-adding enzyme BshC
MGSEDADLDELGSITVHGEKYTWQTKQTGAVGRMKVDKDFLALINRVYGQTGVEAYGAELTNIFRDCYQPGTTIQQATLALVNALFGKYGLVVLVPDNANLKRAFMPVIAKELREGFSHKIVTATLAQFEKHYKAQAGGRDINLFYLVNDKRERIEKEADKWVVKTLALEWTEEGVLKELEEHPERFSPNVILRGVFQETVLPNIAFIGGGGELAYWLELKDVFEAANVPYPVLVLRNSFLLVEEKWRNKQQHLGLNAQELFKPEQELMDKIVAEKSGGKYHLNGELTSVQNAYAAIRELAAKVDVTLVPHVESLRVKAVKHLVELEKKLKSAEKRKFDNELVQIRKIKEALFPNNNLQERVENLAGFYAKHGAEIIDALLNASLALEQQLMVMYM